MREQAGTEQLSGSTWQHSHMALLTGRGKVWYSDGAVWFIQQLQEVLLMGKVLYASSAT